MKNMYFSVHLGT